MSASKVITDVNSCTYVGITEHSVWNELFRYRSAHISKNNLTFSGNNNIMHCGITYWHNHLSD